MHGNSQVRQVFEALACGFADQITNLTLQVKPRLLPNVTMAKMEGDSSHLYHYDSFASMADEEGSIGCHGAGSDKELKHWYRKDVAVPRSLPHCDDGMAMVEFGKAIRIFFMFHPTLVYKNLTAVYDRMGLQSEDIDAFVFNRQEAERYPEHIQLKPGVRKWEWGDMLDFVKLQKRDLGKWWGAHNPGLVRSVDPLHGCMPGVPDDEANLLLFLWLRNAGVLLSKCQGNCNSAKELEKYIHENCF
jgi:hypothetical protein